MNSSRIAAAVLTAAFLFAPSSFAEEGASKKWKKLWIASAVMLTASSFCDLGTSVGQFEANPLLRDSQGRFAMGRGIALKSGTAGSLLLLQYFATRHSDKNYKVSALVDFAGAGAYSTIAYRNYRLVHR